MVKVRKKFSRFLRSIGIRRHGHEAHRFTLRRLILCSCLFAIGIVGVSSYLFYADSRSKYDLVRPGRRELPEAFQAESNLNQEDATREEVASELSEMKTQLDGLDIYGTFSDDALSDYKVMQGYLDQPINEE